MVMTLEAEDAWFDLRVPHVDIMIETGTQNHVHICVPIKGMHSKLMSVCEEFIES